MFIKRSFAIGILLGAVVLVNSGCKKDDYYFRNDYSTVPVLPDTANAISNTVTEDGLRIFVIAPGDSSQLQVNIRDRIYFYSSTRSTRYDNYGENEDAVLQSSYANGLSTMYSISNLSAQTTVSYVPTTFGDAVLGMYEGEHRVVIFPDSLTAIGQELVLDIELEEIGY